MKSFSIINSRIAWFSALFLMLANMLVSSCQKDIYEEADKSINVPLALSLSKDTVVLKESEFGADAIAFNWTAGSNNGTNSAILYKLYIDKEGNNFRNAIVESLGKTNFQKKYSVKDFNNLLVSDLHLTPGITANLEAKVVAQVAGSNFSDSVSRPFMVTAYQPVSTTLYLIGSAAPNGWSAENATALTLNSSLPGRFVWQGKLNVGELKFITSKGQFLPSYNKGATANRLLYRTADSQADDKFVITKTGSYTVSVNLLDLSLSIEEGAAPPYAQLWMVGDATPNGWNIDNPNSMRQDRSDPFVFTYGEVLKAGEFKIPTAKGNWGTDFYMPLVNNQPLNLTSVRLTPGGNPDNKWKVATAGAYKIKLNITPGQEKIEIKSFPAPSELFMVGDATPAGWNIDNPTPLVKDATNPYVFKFTGALKAGELKFPIAKGNWGTDFYMPVIANEDASSTQVKFVPAGNPDNKWKITAAQAGNYIITIDVLHETISFQKQ